ncbi:hypothetical protein DZB87_23865 [Bacillus sp. ALD]|nr:hypothetical protein DZB87_23865 [Bacillus sp. ALD]RFB34348.1 hypothetical protein DZB86_24515 [Bacillus sp. RC]
MTIVFPVLFPFGALVMLASCNIFKYQVRKSIPLRTFILYKKSIIFIVRLNLKMNYERLMKCIKFYERF